MPAKQIMLQEFRGILLLQTDNTEYAGMLRSSISKHRHINKSVTCTLC